MKDRKEKKQRDFMSAITATGDVPSFVKCLRSVSTSWTRILQLQQVVPSWTDWFLDVDR
jgi:hypothetical protein